MITTINDIISPDEHLIKVSTYIEFGFTEGCSWDRKGALYFSDVNNNKIIKYELGSNKFSVWAENTEAGNGTMFTRDGFLYVCEGGARRVAAYNSDGKRIKIVADSYNGKKLNSPNDICIDRNGGVYFSDPRYGDIRGKEQEIDCVYYIHPDGEIIRAVDDRVNPNGLILSPDESILYVNDSWFPYIRAYEVQSDGTVKNGRNFARVELPPWNSESGVSLIRTGTDGMTIDQLGNLYVTTQVGLQIFNSGGERLYILKIPEKPTNCTFGGQNNDILFITAQKSLYQIRTKMKGTQFQQ